VKNITKSRLFCWGFSYMWTPIFNQNSENIIDVIETYINKLQDIKTKISENDKEGIKEIIDNANKIKRII